MKKAFKIVIAVFVAVCLAFCGLWFIPIAITEQKFTQGSDTMNIPNSIFSGYVNSQHHVQGIAVDTEREVIYFSFTTFLLKTDFEGNTIGSVDNLAGHLGCITFDKENNKVYGSLEFKHDSIGKSIEDTTGKPLADEDAFYAVSFDCERITEIGLDAESTGIMKSVYLTDVVNDYTATDEVSGREHRYGCSGIDGTALGPVFGEYKNSEKKIMIAYGIYEDTDRSDNDYQVILQYSTDIFEEYGENLDQSNPHHSGPEKAEEKYFFYTGNTDWGIQNLEYDPYTENYFVSVYYGRKKAFNNYDLFFIDANTAPKESKLSGRNGETGLVLSHGNVVPLDENGISGCRFDLGETGLYAFGDGTYYFSDPSYVPLKSTHTSTVNRYKLNKNSKEFFEKY